MIYHTAVTKGTRGSTLVSFVFFKQSTQVLAASFGKCIRKRLAFFYMAG